MNTEKYLVELVWQPGDSDQKIDRVYFDDIDELLNYLKYHKETLFNCGFTSKEIRMYRIEKGEL